MSPRIMCHDHELTDSEKDFITTKIGRLKKYYDRITEVSVILDSAKRTALAEILTSGPHVNLRFKHEAADMRTAFEGALNKAEQGLRKTKEKKWGDKMHKRNSVTIRRFNPMGFDFSVDLASEEPHPVESLRPEAVEPKPMSLEEAYAELRAHQTGLFVFLSTATGKVTILHRNAEEEIEMLEIEGDDLPLDHIVEMHASN
jgi:putative sigma-54 modulation protein